MPSGHPSGSHEPPYSYNKNVKIPEQHVLIAGAGIIGLAAALALRAAGYRVTVVERGRAMEEASWAAAGMLAVEDPENASALRPLSRFSRALYPEFLQRVEKLSGIAVPFRTAATLQGLDGAGGAAPEELPALRTEHHHFIRLAEASLDPRDLCRALPRAAVAAGVELVEHTEVAEVVAGDGSVRVTLGDGANREADTFVLAAGAWSGVLGGLPLAPRKGQMIEVTLDAGVSLPLVVRTRHLYLVPRGDGRVVVGATVEHAGFDRAVDREAGEALWAEAAALWPPILKGRITSRWTGLRPGYSPGIEDALPVIGLAGERQFVATGHFRNGILLAPGTAQVLLSLIRGETPLVEIAAFAPERFLALAAPAMLLHEM